jgi:hypothetical protein
MRIIWHLDDIDRQDPGLRELPDYFSQSYPRMLLEDVGRTIVPHSGARVGFHPADETAERIVAEGISLRDYRKDLGWTAHMFFDRCAQRTMAYGEDVYAIVYLSEKEGGKPIEFDLMPLPAETVKRKRGMLSQYVPRSQRRDPNRREYIELPAEQTIVFNLPEHLRAIVARTLKGLASVGGFGMPDWAMEELGYTRKRVPFDASVHTRSHRLAVADACKDLGWNARSLDNEGMLKFYVLYRELRFERFKARLRDHLLDILNKGLTGIGTEVGFSGRLTLEGVPTLSEVEAAESELAAGSQSFKDLMQPFMPF